MSLACPDPLRLGRLPLGAPDADREALLAHASVCASCRRLLGDLAAEPEPLSARAGDAVRVARPSRGRAWAPYAAAVLMLAAGVAVLRDPEGPGEVARPLQLPDARPPFDAPEADGTCSARDGDLAVLVGRTGRFTLRVGTRARLQGLEAVLGQGCLLVEGSGETLRVCVGEARVESSRGKVLVEAGPAGPVAGWLRSAWAAAASGRVLVLEGEAALARPDGAFLRLCAGEEADLAAGPVRPASPAPWRGEAGWEDLEGLPLRLGRESRILAPGDLAGDFAWEALCSRLGPTASVGISFPAGGAGWELPVGGAWTGEVLRVRVTCRHGWIRIEAGAREVLRCRFPDLPRRVGTGPAACGLRAWGGEVEVREARWRRGP